jgi:WD repeat-containing protein 19
MAWSKDNLLSIGAEDNRISVMFSNGSILQRCDTNETPRNVKFSEMKREKRGTYEESTVSAIIGKKHLGLWTVGDPNSNTPPAAGSQLFTLNFQDKYGDIIDYQWFGDGYIMIGFSGGYFIVISTYHKEIGEVNKRNLF